MLARTCRLMRFATFNSSQWKQRQQNDSYVQQSKKENYRSRAIYKLMEIDTHHKIFKANSRVIELGCSPGSWTQYLAQKVNVQSGNGLIVAVDILPMKSVCVT